MAKSYDATGLIERLEMFEDRLGVTLEALSASVEVHDDGSVAVSVRGELHSRTGVDLENDIRLQLAVYDSNGRVVSDAAEYINKEDFFGLEMLSMMTFSSIRIEPAKIRIFPQKA